MYDDHDQPLWQCQATKETYSIIWHCANETCDGHAHYWVKFADRWPA